MMSLKSRIERLEMRNPTDDDPRRYPVHYYEVEEGDTSGHTRENCPMCAAMSDEEYAAYKEWTPKTKRVTFIEAVLTKDWRGVQQ